jgi:hypothetical protein
MNFMQSSLLPVTDRQALTSTEIGPGPEDPQRQESIRQSSRAPLPWFLAEKYFWTDGPAGRQRLSPLPEFLRSISEDAPKLADYGYSLLRPTNGSTEASVVDTLRQELTGVLESFSALDDRESRAFARFLSDRALRNAVYAAITQFELDRWVAKSAARGQDASEHTNFPQKESRRDSFATVAAAFVELCAHLFPDEKLTAARYGRMARQVVYQQADVATREHVSPQQEADRDVHAVQAAVLASRPF